MKNLNYSLIVPLVKEGIAITWIMVIEICPVNCSGITYCLFILYSAGHSSQFDLIAICCADECELPVGSI